MRLLSALFAVLLAAAPAGAVEIRTATGLVDVAPNPKTLAVFDIAAIDTLQRLGVTPDGVPGQLYLPELKPLAAKAQRVGTLFDPDLEALSALAPDLVIVGGRSSTRAEAARQVAPTIDMTMTGDDLLAEARQRLDAYGTLFDKTAEAEAAKAELDGAVAKARAAAEGKGSALVLMTNGPKITAYGPGSRFGWIYAALGLKPAAVGGAAAGLHGEAVSFEYVAKADPDWLIVVDRAAAIGSDGGGARATLDNELVAGTKAWRKGQVVELPAADAYVAAGGVQAMGRILAQLSAAFSAAQ
jgi:iron complex transport system substrate-binding protein